MPITFSYDIDNANLQPVDYNRLQSMFERLGWQRIGGSCYRYPQLSDPPLTEDWMNHVIPALMLFRTYVLEHQLVITRLALDAHSSTGYDPSVPVGQPPLQGNLVPLTAPNNQQFGEAHLRDWLTNLHTPYP